jgi:hypothetical protein
MKRSIREQERATKDKVVESTWKPSRNHREAFKDEDRAMEALGGITGGRLYNKINSPGRKYRIQDGD